MPEIDASRATASRRGVLAGSLACATGSLACATGSLIPAADAKSRPRFALADITVLRDLERDYAGTLRRVAAMGYSVMGFRLAGYAGRGPNEPTPADKARLVREAGMEVGVVRLGVINADYDRELDEAAATGTKLVALTTAPPFIAGRPMFTTTRDKFAAWLPQLAAIGEKAKARGLKLAYHNHWYDLAPLDGERPLDLMARTIPPELLAFELDLAWTWFGGVAPLDLIGRLGPRVVSMHWKDIDRSRGKTPQDHAVVPGAGEMDYAALLPRVVRATRAVGYIEIDNPPDGLAAARQGAAFIKKVLG